MKNNNWLDVSDFPAFCDNVPDYREEAYKQAKQEAKIFGVAYVMYNGLYYQVVVGENSLLWWRRKGYKVIHTEESDEMKRSNHYDIEL